MRSDATLDTRMRFSLMTEPQLGGTYAQILSAARWAEDNGLASFARSDHYYSSRDPKPDATDALTTLAGLARDTESIRLCVLVSPLTFRHPAVIAKTAATIDQMSYGRLDLGVGTGWMEVEHEAYGIPFPEWSERFSRLSEALPYLRESFSGEGASFDGDHYTLDADVFPEPSGVRLIVGGTGKQKTPTLAGQYADEYNHLVADAEELGPKIEVMRQAAADADRDPDSITISVMGPSFVGRDEEEYRSIITEAAASRDVDVSDFEQRLDDSAVPRGWGDRVAETLAAWSEVGVDQYYMQWIDLADISPLEGRFAALRDAASGL